MSKVISNSPAPNLEIALFKDLASAVQNAGIPIDLSNERDTRRDALAFIVGANREFYGSKCRLVVDKLIEDVKMLTLQGGSCEVSWRLNQEVSTLIKAKVLQLGESNKNFKSTLNAICGLYDACKAKNAEQHQKGEPVHFGGVPGDLVPDWCRDSNLE